MKLTIQYLGANYHGWQMQPNCISVEQKVTEAVSFVLKEKVRLYGCGRTDVGVNALNYVAHIDINSTITPSKLCLATNLNLPKDISIVNAEVVEMNFDARKSSTSKTYVYKMYVSSYRNPFLDIDHLQIYKPLDVDAMKEAANDLIGTHNFIAFRSIGSNIPGTVRTINFCNIECVGNVITVELNGNAFLYNMVRIIVGTLVDVGNKRLSVDVIKQMIETGNRRLGGKTLPSQGLTLLNVYYN